MTDKPAESAVERYERLKVTESWPSDDSTLGRADAALAELKAENEALRRMLFCSTCGGDLRKSWPTRFYATDDGSEPLCHSCWYERFGGEPNGDD